MGAFWFRKAARLPGRFPLLAVVFGLLAVGSSRGAGADTYTVTNLLPSGVGSLTQVILNANAHAGADTIVFAPGVAGNVPLGGPLPVLTDDVEIDGPGANLLNIVTDLYVIPRFSALQIGSAAGTGVGPTVSISGLAFIAGKSSEGGAISNVRGTVTVRNCEIGGNVSNNFGGGVTNAGTMVLQGCTIDGNRSAEDGAEAVASRLGGGDYNTGVLTMTNCTVSGNVVHTIPSTSQQIVSRGGGIYNTGALTFDDTILQDGAVTSIILTAGGSLVNVGGTIVSKGYNLSNDSANGLLTGPGDRSNIVPLLGPLQDNGGTTRTRLPLLGSPAIDAGDPAFPATSATDQRGRPRVIGPRTDIGAVEYKPPFDFIGDGHNDLLFQNSQTGRLVAWSLNGLSVQSSVSLISTPAAGWKYVGSADLNRDGWPDMIFQNTTTKQMVVWYMRGALYIGGAVMPPPPPINSTVPAPTYTAVGVSDLGGNPYVVFEDTANRQIYYWVFGATPGVPVYQTSPYGPFLPNYHVVGVGDFNRDGRFDLLFQNTVTRQLVVSQFDGTTFAGGGVLTPIPESGWEVKAVVDYNNDGWPDIVFQNTTTNKLVAWFLNDLSFTSGGLISAQPLAPYQGIGPH